MTPQSERDLERVLTRELHHVADTLDVPPAPAAPATPAAGERTRRGGPIWLAAAAAVVLLAVGAPALLSQTGNDLDPAPAGPEVAGVSTAPAKTPHVVDGALFVDGEQVPGRWWSVRSGADVWLAWREFGAFAWGRGSTVHELDTGDGAPHLSPLGRHIAYVSDRGGDDVLTVLTTSSGTRLKPTPVTLRSGSSEEFTNVIGVTDEAQVLLRRGGRDLLWWPGAEEPLDLSVTAPGLEVLSVTGFGIVTRDEDTGETQLSRLEDGGQLSTLYALPEHDDFLFDPTGTLHLWTPAGTTGGDVTEVADLLVEVGYGDGERMSAPEGWAFKTRMWQWEDDRHVVAPVVSTSGDDQDERMVRCQVEVADPEGVVEGTECVLLEEQWIDQG